MQKRLDYLQVKGSTRTKRIVHNDGEGVRVDAFANEGILEPDLEMVSMRSNLQKTALELSKQRLRDRGHLLDIDHRIRTVFDPCEYV